MAISVGVGIPTKQDHQGSDTEGLIRVSAMDLVTNALVMPMDAVELGGIRYTVFVKVPFATSPTRESCGGAQGVHQDTPKVAPLAKDCPEHALGKGLQEGA